MRFRTDLTLERKELFNEDLPGVHIKEGRENDIKLTVIDIENPHSAEKLGKAVGKYITIEMNDFSNEAAITDGRLNALVGALTELLPEKRNNVLVAGIGNGNITADALGPVTASHIFATRHIDDELKSQIGFSQSLASVASVATGVLGQTGIETGEYIKAVTKIVNPDFVITVDALAAGSVKRLGKTVQLSDTGIAPGSGIGNRRVRIDEDFLGVPVIAIGVPTVVDSVALSMELSGGDEKTFKEKIGDTLIVTPKDIDLLTKNASYLIGFAINCVLQPTLSREDLYALM